MEAEKKRLTALEEGLHLFLLKLQLLFFALA
jgi:hypothetical protein